MQARPCVLSCGRLSEQCCCSDLIVPPSARSIWAIRAMKTNNRVMFGAGALVCAALLAYAYYLQYAQGLEPCPLCLMQRGFFYAVMALFVLGALHGPGRTGAWIYSALIVLFAGGGAATAGRQ